MAVPLNKSWFSSLTINCQWLLNYKWDFMLISILHAGILSDLDLYRSRAFLFTCSEFTCASARLVLASLFSRSHVPLLYVTMLPILHLQWSLSVGKKSEIDVTFMTEQFTVIYFLYPHDNQHLLWRKVTIMRAEKYLNL